MASSGQIRFLVDEGMYMKSVTTSAIAALMISLSSANAATVSFDFGSVFQKAAGQSSAISSIFGGGLANFFSAGGSSSGSSSGGAKFVLLVQMSGRSSQGPGSPQSRVFG